jgi:hypothetical protein
MNLCPTPAPGSIINPQNYPPMAIFCDIGSLTKAIVPLLTLVAGIIFLVMLFYAAFTVLTAGGEAEKLDKAKNIATYAVIGLLIIIFAFFIVRIVGFVFKVPVPI